MEVLNRGYTNLHLFADYNYMLKVEPSAKEFLQTSGSFSKEALNQLQQFSSQRRWAAPMATEKRM